MLVRAARLAGASVAARAAAPAGARFISFELTEDQRAFQKLARDFAVNEVIPAAAELDRTMEYPEELFNKVSRRPRAEASAGRPRKPHPAVIAPGGALAARDARLAGPRTPTQQTHRAPDAGHAWRPPAPGGRPERQQNGRAAKSGAVQLELPPAASLPPPRPTRPPHLPQAWELGLVNGHIPEKYGGMGLHALDGVIIAEELAYGCTGVMTAMEANSLAEVSLVPRAPHGRAARLQPRSR